MQGSTLPGHNYLILLLKTRCARISGKAERPKEGTEREYHLMIDREGV